MENPHWVTWPSKQNTNATVAMECYHMRYNGYGGDTATWKQWIVGMKLRSGQLFADVYKVISTHPETSSYTIDLPPDRGDFPTYYASELKLHIPNDSVLFPSREHSRPGPILTLDGLQEHEIDRILDSRPRGRGYQFLICWKGFSPEDDKWLTGRLLEDCEVLGWWYESGGDGPGSARYLPSRV
jgi:hypothetical protein